MPAKKKTEETTDNPCTGDNEELGADKKTCVCKNGYTKEDGKCVKKETKANFINELVVTGGSPAYDAETKEEVVEGGNQIPYDPNVIQAAIEERERLIKEGQNKPKTNTNNTKPSGASRGRQIGF